MKAGNNCLYCNASLKGRTDKKFCDAGCRNAYHNSHHAPEEAYIKEVNKTLRKNRSILRRCSPEGKTTIRRSALVTLGFNFYYNTHTFTSKNGNSYKFCYDYGYMPVQENKILIVKRQEYMAR